jgi:hypothetical protein
VLNIVDGYVHAYEVSKEQIATQQSRMVADVHALAMNYMLLHKMKRNLLACQCNHQNMSCFLLMLKSECLFVALSGFLLLD